MGLCVERGGGRARATVGADRAVLRSSSEAFGRRQAFVELLNTLSIFTQRPEQTGVVLYDTAEGQHPFIGHPLHRGRLGLHQVLPM